MTPRLRRPAKVRRALRTARRHVRHHQTVYSNLLRNQAVAAVIGAENTSAVRSAIRAAAVRASVTRLSRDRLQSFSIWLVLVLSFVGAIAVMWVVPPGHDVHLPGLARLGIAFAGVMLSATLLALAVIIGRGPTHFVATTGLAVAGVLYLVAWRRPPDLMVILAAVGILPFLVYVAFVPPIVIAYIVALRLSRTVDPRARIVLDLLTSAELAASGTAWLRRADARDHLAAVLERVARTAERDLPRLQPRRVADRTTREWLVNRGRSVAARIRETKQSVLLSSPTTVDGLRHEIALLLLQACRGDWAGIGGDRTAPPSPSRLRDYIAQLRVSMVLFGSALAITWFVAPALGSAGLASVRDGLIVAAVLALIPVPRGEFSRISDTFGELAQP